MKRYAAGKKTTVEAEIDQQDHRVRSVGRRTGWLLIATAANLLLLIFLWTRESGDRRFAMDTAKQAAASELASIDAPTTGWAEDYVASHAYSPTSTQANGALSEWLETKLESFSRQQSSTTTSTTTTTNNTTQSTAPSSQSTPLPATPWLAAA